MNAMPKRIESRPLELRHYQEKAVSALWQGFAEEDGNLLVVLPARTGKALSICEFTRRATMEYPETRSLIMTHSMELVDQNVKEMINLWPECPVGICNAGLGQKNTKSQIIFGSIQSMHSKALALQRVDIIHVDEAQSIPRKEGTQWLKFFEEVKKINPYVRIAGWTATPFRLDSGRLDDGPDAMFKRVVYEYPVLDAIKEGYLVPPISQPSLTQIDTSHVGTRGGEFIPNQLNAAACDPDVVNAIADEMVEKGKDRKTWIFFGSGVEHCLMVRDALMERGIVCEGVFATTPKAERKDNIERFRRHEIRCLVSVNALAVGFNVKSIDLVGLGRPTQSTGFYIQAAMRGMTLYPEKSDCLILDWGGNIRRHGMLDQPQIKPKGKGGMGEMPVKVCQICQAENFIAARECSTCGAPFLIVGSKIDTRASTGPLLSSQIVPEWCDVASVRYAVHNKPDKPPSLRVTYLVGLTSHSEWVTLQHQGYPRQKAEKWWLARASGPVPVSVEEALARAKEIRKPTKILVKPVGKYTEIMNARFE